MEHDFINKEQQSLHNIMLAINRLISLNVYWILFFTDGVYNYNNQILLLQEGNVNKDRKKEKKKWFLLHTHKYSTTMQRIQSMPTRGNQNMNTVHLSLFPPHETARTQSITRSTGLLLREYSKVECDWEVEMRTGKVCRFGVYSSNVRKAFCMSSSSWVYSALILASPSFNGSLNFMELTL